MHAILALALCITLATHGIRKKSLSPSGAAAAFFVGAITFICAGDDNILYAGILLTFYLSGSRATKYKQERKRQFEEDFQEGGRRTAVQVFSNGLTGAIVCALHYYLVRSTKQQVCFGRIDTQQGLLHTALISAFIGHYACCCGDTWASELGILSKGEPFLITSLEKVPRGTNGGVSLLGLGASAAGGMLIGVVAALGLPWHNGCPGSPPYFFVLALAVFSGLLGSLVDSLLGATFQKSIYNAAKKQIASDHRRLRKGEAPNDLKHISGKEVLDNHQVNFISSLFTSLVAACIGVVYWGKA